MINVKKGSRVHKLKLMDEVSNRLLSDFNSDICGECGVNKIKHKSTTYTMCEECISNLDKEGE